ncbi:hypothetical protein DWB63_05020 [Pseudodesulfovibrio sp. S3]|nr:hypothetical protein DWB63_05020 [Pseudodesulfovibrio sp. S3]
MHRFGLHFSASFKDDLADYPYDLNLQAKTMSARIRRYTLMPMTPNRLGSPWSGPHSTRDSGTDLEKT